MHTCLIFALEGAVAAGRELWVDRTGSGESTHRPAAAAYTSSPDSNNNLFAAAASYHLKEFDGRHASRHSGNPSKSMHEEYRLEMN